MTETEHSTKLDRLNRFTKGHTTPRGKEFLADGVIVSPDDLKHVDTTGVMTKTIAYTGGVVGAGILAAKQFTKLPLDGKNKPVLYGVIAAGVVISGGAGLIAHNYVQKHNAWMDSLLEKDAQNRRDHPGEISVVTTR